MRIIKRGNLPENDMFKGKCGYCKTVFECQRHEGKPVGSNSIEVPCPVCTRTVQIYGRNDGAQIPEYMWDGGLHSSAARQIADIESRGVIPR